MDPVELAAQVAVTEAFIAARPVTLVLTPMVQQGDGSGGRKTVSGDPRPPQQMRFVESSSGRANIRPTEIGEQYAEDAMLLGMPDVSIEVNDEFEYDGSTWKVQEMLFDNEYETRAVVIRYGR